MVEFIYIPTEVRGSDPVHAASVNVEHIVKIIVHDPQYLEVFLSDGSTLRVEEEVAAKHILTGIQSTGIQSTGVPESQRIG